MTGLSNALNVICDRINAYLENRSGLGEAMVRQSQPGDDTANGIAMCVYNLTYDTGVSSYRPSIGDPRGIGIETPPAHLDVHLMFAANFADGNMPEGVKLIAEVAVFLSKTPVFTPENTPELSPAIRQVTVVPTNLTTAELANIATMFGTPYRPSLFYRVRGITLA